MKRLVSIASAAGAVGLFFGVVLSGDEVISARVSLGAAAVTVIVILLRDFLAASSVEPARFVPAWSLRRQNGATEGPRGLQNIHALLVNSPSNARTYAIHLRPRLEVLARHYLPLRQGIDVQHDREGVADLLGDVAWLIDPTVQDRTPTMAEIERFLDLILAEHNAPPAGAGAGARVSAP